MKKFMLACLAATTAFAGSAQIIRSTTSERTFTTVNEPVVEKTFSNYGLFTISYDNMSYGFNKDAGGSDSNFSTNGVGLNFYRGYSVSSKIPLYVEWGLFGSFGTHSESETEHGYKYTSKFRNLNFGVPVNVAYRFNPTGDIYIKPYLGINFRVNALSDVCSEITEDGEKLDVEGNGDWNSVFDTEDGEDCHWKRFQMGWQIGVGFEIKALYLALQYGTDFIPAFSYESAKVNNGTFKLQLGVSF